MKNLFTLLIAVLALFAMVSCKKPANTPPGNATVSIAGKWNIVSDSTGLTPSGPFNGWGKMYIGTPADYYDFTNSGGLSVLEGTFSDDTLLYKVGHDTLSISFTYTHPDFQPTTYNNFFVDTLTAHKLVISSTTAGYVLPSGILYEIMVFKR